MSATRYEQNLQRWALFCPQEAEQLQSSPSVANDETLLTASLEECTEAVSLLGTQDTATFYCYGLENGYYYEILKEWLQASSKHQLVFLEPSLVAINHLLDTSIGSTLLFHPQVWIYYLDPEGLVLDKITTLFSTHTWELVITQRKIEQNPTHFQQIRSKLSFLSNMKHASLSEYLHFGWGYFQNFFRNVLTLPHSLLSTPLYGSFKGVPAIICGAGPSLEKNRHLLESLKDKALIFAGGTAMNAINAGNVLPHFGIGIDPNPDQYTRIVTNTAFEIPYFYRNRLQHISLTQIHGDHLYVPGTGGYGVTKWLEESLGIGGKDIPEGCNVINFSLSIAEALGCSPIVFVGVDLAYSNEGSYAPGIINHPIHKRREHFRTKNTNEEIIVKPDIFGNNVQTLWKWVMESYWFTAFAAHHPETTLVNGTEGGLGFLTIPNMSLKEFADKYLVNSYDLAGAVHAELQRCKMPNTVTNEAIQQFMCTLKTGLKGCAEHISAIEIDIRTAIDSPEGDLRERLLSSLATGHKAALEAEDAYIHFLKVFDNAFSTYIEIDHVRLDIDRAHLSAKEIDEKKCQLLLRRYQFLKNVVEANTQHLNDACVPMLSLERPTAPVQTARADHPILKAAIDKDASAVEMIKKDHAGNVVARYFLLSGQLHGPFIHYSPQGAVLAYTQYVEGRREGAALYYYQSGALASKQGFLHNLPDGELLCYYEDGTPKSEINYSNGLLHGQVNLYNRQGKLCRSLAFNQGKRFGVERIWNTEGALVIEADYKDDIPKGVAKKWHANGNLALEMVYDEEGRLMSSRKWSVEGMLIPDNHEEDDYFDLVNKETETLTLNLDNIVNQVINVVPIIRQTMNKDISTAEINSMQGELDSLKEQMENLKRLNQQLLKEAGLDAAEHKEPIWKSPRMRKELELQVEQKAAKMSQELSSIQIAFAQTINQVTQKLQDDAIKELQAKEKQNPLSDR